MLKLSDKTTTKAFKILKAQNLYTKLEVVIEKTISFILKK